MPPITRSQTKGARLIQKYRVAYQVEQEWKQRLRDMRHHAISLHHQDSDFVSARMDSLSELYKSIHNYMKYVHGDYYLNLLHAYQKATYELGKLTDDDPERLFKQLRRTQQVAKENLYGCMDSIQV